MLRALIIILTLIAFSTPVLARETQEQNNARATKQMNQTIFQMQEVRKTWPQNKDMNKKAKKKKKQQKCPEGYTKYSVRKNNKTVYECREDASPRNRKGGTGGY